MERLGGCRIALALGLVGCGGGAPTDGVATFDTLSTGIVRVSNAIARAPVWRLELVRQFADRPGEQLSDPAEIRVDGAGRVYVLDDDPPTIRVFSADGASLRTIGREGSGPGEFQGGGMLLVSRDTMVHQDQRQSRAQAFTLDGRLIGQWSSPCCVRVPTLADDQGRFPLPGDVGRVPPGGGDAGAGMGYQRFRADGSVIDTLDFPPAPLPQMWRATDGRDRWNWRIPLQPQVAHVLDREGRLIWGDQRSGAWVISRTGRDTVGLFVAEEPPPAIPDSIRQGVVDGVVARNPAFATIAKVDDVPTTYPAWLGMTVDDANRIWVQRPGGDDRGGHWHVFDATGRLLARVEAPALEPERLHITEEYVYALEPDESTGLDVVRVYAIRRD